MVLPARKRSRALSDWRGHIRRCLSLGEHAVPAMPCVGRGLSPRPARAETANDRRADHMGRAAKLMRRSILRTPSSRARWSAAWWAKNCRRCRSGHDGAANYRWRARAAGISRNSCRRRSASSHGNPKARHRTAAMTALIQKSNRLPASAFPISSGIETR